MSQANQINLSELAKKAGTSNWVADMLDHYKKTGKYRRKDLIKVLGDQTRPVSMPTQETARQHFCCH